MHAWMNDLFLINKDYTYSWNILSTSRICLQGGFAVLKTPGMQHSWVVQSIYLHIYQQTNLSLNPGWANTIHVTLDKLCNPSLPSLL